jgi:hypothetical protein
MSMQAPPPVHAAESCQAAVATAVAKSAGIKRKKSTQEDFVVAAACKLWPYDNKTLLSAIAFSTDNVDEKVLVVAMSDAKSGRVINWHKTEVSEDAAVHVGEGSLSIDTAPYQLAKGVRAFGVRFTSDAPGASCAEGVWSDELSLFIPTPESLEPVLQGLAMTRKEARKGCFGDVPELVYDDAKLSLGLAKTNSHGFADLIVTARVRREGEAVGSSGKATIEQYTLRYDGNEYQGTDMVPWWLTFFSLGH